MRAAAVTCGNDRWDRYGRGSARQPAAAHTPLTPSRLQPHGAKASMNPMKLRSVVTIEAARKPNWRMRDG